MTATVVTNDDELKQIILLSEKNLRTKISKEQEQQQGFVTWNYSFDLLKQMNTQHPHVIVKNGNDVIGYALVALKEAARFHTDLKGMIDQLETITYKNIKLEAYKYYVMGQVCIDDDYRGKGVFQMLYHQHKKLFKNDFDFVVTEISTNNKRSMKAHENTGFKTIYSYYDVLDEWNVVLWDWS
jgi:hypothetical protein